MTNDRLKKIVWEYFNAKISREEWRWVSLSFDSDIHFLFVNPYQTILSARADKSFYDHDDRYMISKYYVSSTDLLCDLIYMFGEENYVMCKILFIDWVKKNIPLDATKTNAIGGKKRIV